MIDITLETGAKFAVVAVRELEGVQCYCGAKKKTMQTFCYAEYRALPPKKRSALYNRIFDGYEEAYKDARAYLQELRNPALTRVE